MGSDRITWSASTSITWFLDPFNSRTRVTPVTDVFDNGTKYSAVACDNDDDIKILENSEASANHHIANEAASSSLRVDPVHPHTLFDVPSTPQKQDKFDAEARQGCDRPKKYNILTYNPIESTVVVQASHDKNVSSVCKNEECQNLISRGYDFCLYHQALNLSYTQTAPAMECNNPFRALRLQVMNLPASSKEYTNYNEDGVFRSMLEKSSYVEKWNDHHDDGE